MFRGCGDTHNALLSTFQHDEKKCMASCDGVALDAIDRSMERLLNAGPYRLGRIRLSQIIHCRPGCANALVRSLHLLIHRTSPRADSLPRYADYSLTHTYSLY